MFPLKNVKKLKGLSRKISLISLSVVMTVSIFTFSVFADSSLSTSSVLSASVLGEMKKYVQTSDNSALNTMIDQRIEAFVQSDRFQEAVDAAIQKFIEKQTAADQKAQNAQQVEQEKNVQKVRKLSSSRDHIRGNVKAKISIIEFSDFECPFCKRNHPTVQLVLDKYGNNVNWGYRHLPLEFHFPNAMDQAEASECVASLKGNDAFWKFTDLIFERTESNKSFAFEKLKPLAEEVGVDGAKFDECMKSDKMLVKVQANIKEAQKMEILGTPANIIRNNETGEVKFLGGAYPVDYFIEIIDEMLK